MPTTTSISGVGPGRVNGRPVGQRSRWILAEKRRLCCRVVHVTNGCGAYIHLVGPSLRCRRIHLSDCLRLASLRVVESCDRRHRFPSFLRTLLRRGTMAADDNTGADDDDLEDFPFPFSAPDFTRRENGGVRRLSDDRRFGSSPPRSSPKRTAALPDLFWGLGNQRTQGRRPAAHSGAETGPPRRDGTGRSSEAVR